MSNVPAITDADIQFLTSLDDELVGPGLDYSKLPTTNNLTEVQVAAIAQAHKNIDKYATQFTKIPDAYLTIEVNLTSEKHPQHGVESHHVLWSQEDEKNPGESLCYDCYEFSRVIDHSTDTTN